MCRIKITLTIAVLLSSFFGFSTGKQKKVSLKKTVAKAEEAFYFENYREAIDLYYVLDSLDPEGHNYYMYQIGLSYLYSNLDNEQAIPNIEESVAELTQGELADAVYYHLGRAYQVNYEFDKAIENFTKVLEMVEHHDQKGLQKVVTRQIEICNNAKEIIKMPVDVKIKDVGNGINTSWPDYKPIITADETFLYYTSRRPNSTGGKIDRTGRYYEDIYVSQRDVFGYWGYPSHISSAINTEYDEATIGISADGHSLYLYKGNVKGGGIYVSKLTGTEWSEPQTAEYINSKSWETSATVSSDGKTMYFVSNRKGGKGDRDIYIAQLQDDGTWGDTKNMGPTINTSYDEDTPFIHPNGKTLYFSSTGHNTMGGFDIFKSELIDGEWSNPINMGYPINSTCDDFHFVTNARGSRGYYSSSQTGGLGEQDIYTVDFNDASVPILLVRGNIKTEGIELAQANPKITIIDKANNSALHTAYQPNKTSGKYLITLPPAQEYDMIVEAEGFKPYLTTIKMPEIDEFYEVYQIIILRNLGGGKGQEIVVQNVFEDTRNAINGDTSLIAIANRSNRDYLETITQAISDNSDNESAINQAINMTDHVSVKLLENNDLYTETSSNTYTYDEINPEKDLVSYTVDGEKIMVISDSDSGKIEYLADETIVTNASKEDEDSIADAVSTEPSTYEVKFGFDKHTLAQSYLDEVEIIYNTYKKSKDAYIEISGHTDSKGPSEYNRALSQRRADAVAKYLIEKGVPKDRITTRAIGEDQPIAPNKNPDGSDSPEGRSMNRRTEIKIINH